MRADRLITIMLILQQKGQVTAEWLAEKLEVNVRTIYRDVAALCFAGIPIYTQSGPHGGIFLDTGYRVELTGLSNLEVHSLAVEGAAQPLSDLGLGSVLENAYLKLLAALPGMQRAEMEKIRRRVFLDPKSWFHLQEDLAFLPLLQQAVLDDEEIEILYEKPGRQQTRHSILPHGLVCKSNVWYVVGKVEEEQWRTYRVSRMRGVCLSGKRFERDSDFHLKTYWQESSKAFEGQFKADYPARLRIHPELLEYFEWYLTGRFSVSDTADPLGWLELGVFFYSQLEARMTVMGLGARVEIIEPPDLQQNVLAFAHDILDRAERSGF